MPVKPLQEGQKPCESVFQDETGDTVPIFRPATQVDGHCAAQRAAEDKDPAIVDVRS